MRFEDCWRPSSGWRESIQVGSLELSSDLGQFLSMESSYIIPIFSGWGGVGDGASLHRTSPRALLPLARTSELWPPACTAVSRAPGLAQEAPRPPAWISSPAALMGAIFVKNDFCRGHGNNAAQDKVLLTLAQLAHSVASLLEKRVVHEFVVFKLLP